MKLLFFWLTSTARGLWTFNIQYLLHVCHVFKMEKLGIIEKILYWTDWINIYWYLLYIWKKVWSPCLFFFSYSVIGLTAVQRSLMASILLQFMCINILHSTGVKVILKHYLKRAMRPVCSCKWGSLSRIKFMELHRVLFWDQCFLC